MTLDNNPLEAGLNFFVKMKKETDFIGKQSLLDRKKRGFVPRKLVFMEVDTDNVDPEGNETIWYDDKVSHPEHVDSYIFIAKGSFTLTRNRRRHCFEIGSKRI